MVEGEGKKKKRKEEKKKIQSLTNLFNKLQTYYKWWSKI